MNIIIIMDYNNFFVFPFADSCQKTYYVSMENLMIIIVAYKITCIVLVVKP